MTHRIPSAGPLPVLVLILLASTHPALAEQRLAAIAGGIVLRGSSADGGSIEISHSTLAESRGGGCLSVVNPSVNPDPVPPESADLERRRAVWRERYRRQTHRLERADTELAAARSALETREAELLRARPGSRQALALEQRVATARSRRDRALDVRDRERRELWQLIRAARREGAQPGWFR